MHENMPVELKLIVAQMTIEGIDYRAITLFSASYARLLKGEKLSARDMAKMACMTPRHAPAKVRQLAARGYLKQTSKRYYWILGENMLRDHDLIEIAKRFAPNRLPKLYTN